MARSSARIALLVSVTLALASCAYGRSAAQLRDTPLGRLAPPPGSALAWEIYTPSAFSIDGVQCAVLQRTYASNDADAFQAAVAKIALAEHAKYLTIPDRPVFSYGSLYYSPALSGSDVAGAHFSVTFRDLDDPTDHVPAWIDPRSWRFVIELRLTDEYEGQGGGCH